MAQRVHQLDTEVLQVTVPLGLKIELEGLAERYGVSMAYATAVALELLVIRCGGTDPGIDRGMF